MGVIGGAIYPAIREGLVFCFDPPNPKCWDGGTTYTDSVNGITATFTNMGPTDYTANARTIKGYVYLDGTDGWRDCNS